MGDQYKPTNLKKLEKSNLLSITAQDYGTKEMRMDCIKIPHIDFVEIDTVGCINTVKRGEKYIQYEFNESEDPTNVAYVVISPTTVNKRVGKNIYKYLTLKYYSMIGTISRDHLGQLEK